MKYLMLKALVCLILAYAQAAPADDLYRCGNTYQDTPCKGVVSKPINEKPYKKPSVTIAPVSKNTAPVSNIVTTNKTPAPVTDAECKKRGEAAKVIMKLREIGVTANDQIAIATDSASIARIKDVYSRSGSAFQVQNAVERECMQQLQKTSLTSKWMEQAKRMLGFGTAPDEINTKNKAKPLPITRTAPPKPVSVQPVPTQPVPAQVEPQAAPPVPSAPASVIQPEPVAPAAPVAAPAPPTPDAPIAQPPTPATKPTTQVAPATQKEDIQGDTQGICSSLKAGLANIAGQKRKGGDAATMKDLKDQQDNLESVMKSAGC